MAQTPEILIIILFFLVALFYSSIGFGGGSSYLAIMSLFFTDFELIRTTALVCNVVVVLGSVILFYKNGLIDWRRFLPIVGLSIPAAFVGAQFKLSQEIFFVLLGIALIASALMLLLKVSEGKKSQPKPYDTAVSSALGGGIGLLSGMVGIGGGIFLSPVLNLMQWDTARKIAALASFFILVNSLSGLVGLVVSDTFRMEFPFLFFLLAAVLVGGQIGSRLTVSVLSPKRIKLLTAILVLYVGLRLVLLHTLGISI